MTMDIAKELQDLISKNLPEQTAGAMKEYLKKMENLEVQVRTLKNVNDNLEVSLAHSRDIQTKQGTELQKHSSLTKREEEVTKREVRQELEQLRAMHNQMRADEMKELVSIIFRNQTLVKTRSSWGSMPVERTMSPGYTVVEQHPTNNTETETVEPS